MIYEAQKHPVILLLERDMGNGRVIYDTLVSKASLRLGNHHDGEDIASAVVEKIIVNPWAYEGPIDWSDPRGGEDFTAWLNSVYRSCLVDHFRMYGALKRGSGNVVSLDAFDEETIGVAYEDDRGRREELRKLVGEALSRLGTKYSVAASLVFYEGASYEGAAKILGISLGSLSGKLRIARRRLWTILSDLELGKGVESRVA